MQFQPHCCFFSPLFNCHQYMVEKLLTMRSKDRPQSKHALARLESRSSRTLLNFLLLHSNEPIKFSLG